MDGATLTPGGQVYIDRVDPGYVVKGVGNLDANGKADIVWHHATTGEVWAWPMNGTTRVSEAWVANVPDTGYRIVGTGRLRRGREGGHPVAPRDARGSVDVADGRHDEAVRDLRRHR